MEIGYKLSSEEFAPRDLVRFARMAEDRGFQFALISDHFHPWLDAQGQSPFVWSVLGGIAETTSKIRIGTGVTCPIIRIHPAIIAQAAATAASMMPGRFFLGVGTGEYLNEHIVADGWPEGTVRQAMLREAIYIIRLLWEGKEESFYGAYYSVENAKIYTLPGTLPAIMVAASYGESAELAGEFGDGLISTKPDTELIGRFHSSGGNGKPKIAELTVCWGRDEKTALKLARDLWPISAMPSPAHTEFALPAYFEAAAGLIDESVIAQKIPCGPEPKKFLDAIEKYGEAGFDHVCIHQIGPDQEGFMDFYLKEIFPETYSL